MTTAASASAAVPAAAAIERSPIDRARERALADARGRLDAGDLDEAYRLAGPWRRAVAAAGAARVRAALAAGDDRQAGLVAAALALREAEPTGELSREDWAVIATAAHEEAADRIDAAGRGRTATDPAVRPAADGPGREPVYADRESPRAYAAIDDIAGNLSPAVGWPAARELALGVARRAPWSPYAAAAADRAAGLAPEDERGPFLSRVSEEVRRGGRTGPSFRPLAKVKIGGRGSDGPARAAAYAEAAAAAADPLDRIADWHDAALGSTSAEPSDPDKVVFDLAVRELRAAAGSADAGPYAGAIARAALVQGLLMSRRFEEADRAFAELEAVAAAPDLYPPARAVARELACSAVVGRSFWGRVDGRPWEPRAAVEKYEGAAARYADTAAASAALLQAALVYEGQGDAPAALGVYRRIAARPDWRVDRDFDYDILRRPGPRAAAVEAIANHHRGRGEYAEAARWLGEWEPSSWCGVDLPSLETKRVERLGRMLMLAGREAEAADVLRQALTGPNGLVGESEPVAVVTAELLARRGNLVALAVGMDHIDPVGRRFGTLRSAADLARSAANGDIDGLWHAAAAAAAADGDSAFADYASKLLATMPAAKPLLLREAAAGAAAATDGASAGRRGDRALLVLARMRAPEALDLIDGRANAAAAAAASDPAVAARSTRLLAVLGTPAAYDRLRALAAGPESNVRSAARATLRRWPTPGIAREFDE